MGSSPGSGPAPACCQTPATPTPLPGHHGGSGTDLTAVAVAAALAVAMMAAAEQSGRVRTVAGARAGKGKGMGPSGQGLGLALDRRCRPGQGRARPSRTAGSARLGGCCPWGPHGPARGGGGATDASGAAAPNVRTDDAVQCSRNELALLVCHVHEGSGHRQRVTSVQPVHWALLVPCAACGIAGTWQHSGVWSAAAAAVAAPAATHQRIT